MLVSLTDSPRGVQAISSCATSKSLLGWEVTANGHGPVECWSQTASWSTQYKIWMRVKAPQMSR